MAYARSGDPLGFGNRTIHDMRHVVNTANNAFNLYQGKPQSTYPVLSYGQGHNSLKSASHKNADGSPMIPNGRAFGSSVLTL